MSTDLRARTLRGLAWNTATQVVSQVVAFLVSIWLARTLGPKAFGLVGMITVFTGFAVVVSDLGLGAAIVQRKELRPEHLDAAFWASAAMGLLLTGTGLLLAPALARFYGEAALAPLTSALSVRFVIDALYVVPVARLGREISFDILSRIQLASSVIAGGAAVVLAHCGLGPWSLVGQALVGSIVTLLAAWIYIDWRPRLSFDWMAHRQLLGFSGYLTLVSLTNYWARSLDQLLIGRMAGPVALGFYSRAYSLMFFPLSQVSMTIGRVIFPALSAIQDEPQRVKLAYVKAISMISLVTFPMLMGLYAVSEHFVLFLLGPEWRGVIPLVEVFCWIGVLQSVGTTVGWIYTSQGRTKLALAVGLTTTPAVVVAFFVGVRWGALGVAWAYAVYNLAFWYPLWSIPGRLIGLRFTEMIRSLLPTFGCSLCMLVAVELVGKTLPPGMPHWLCLTIQVPLGIALYATLVSRFKLRAWEETRRAFSELFLAGKRRTA